MTYDAWKTRSPDDGAPQAARCERCNAKGSHDENEYGEFICDDCEQNAAERAWDRQFEGEPPITDRERHVAAWQESRRLK